MKAHTLRLTQDQLDLVNSALRTLRTSLLEKWKITSGEEQAFYSTGMRRVDQLLKDKIDAIAIADKSQDADPEPEEEEDD